MGKTLLRQPWRINFVAYEVEQLTATMLSESTPDPFANMEYEHWLAGFRIEIRPKWGQRHYITPRFGSWPKAQHISGKGLFGDFIVHADLVRASGPSREPATDGAISQVRRMLGGGMVASHAGGITVISRRLSTDGMTLVVDQSGFLFHKTSPGATYWGEGDRDDAPEPLASDTLWSPTPIYGWRTWGIRNDGRHILTGAWMDWEGPEMISVCKFEESIHPKEKVPDWSCSCGVYATKEYPGRSSRDGRYVTGLTALYGKVIEHKDGYRAEKARIVRLNHPFLPSIARRYRIDPKTGETIDEDWKAPADYRGGAGTEDDSSSLPF